MNLIIYFTLSAVDAKPKWEKSHSFARAGHFSSLPQPTCHFHVRYVYVWHFEHERCSAETMRTWTRYNVVNPSVCRLSSVTFVRPSQPVEIFGNVSMPFGTLAILGHPGKILRRSSQGNLYVGGSNAKEVAEYSDFGPRKRCKIAGIR